MLLYYGISVLCAALQPKLYEQHMTVIFCDVFIVLNTITKLPESGVLCDNITEFGVAEDHLSPQGECHLPPPQTKWYCHTAH